MKKNIAIVFIITMLVSLFSTITVMATSKVRVEAEDYLSANFRARKAFSFKDLSAQGLMTFQEEYENGKVYKLVYDVEISEAGLYSMTTASTKLNFGYTADYKIQVNNEEPFSAKNSIMKSEYNTSFSAGIMGIYDIGTVKLNKGNNKITFIVDSKNANNSQVTFHMDYLEFDKAPWGIRSFVPLAPVGVFEENTPVQIEVDYIGTPEDKNIRFEVRDFWSSILLDGEIKIKKGTQKNILNLGVLPKGWYKISLIDGDTTLLFTSVSVVPQMSKRTTVDTPFAVDYASAWLAPSDKWNDYAKALKLAGINWARERFAWGETNPTADKVNYAQYKKTVEVFEKEGINVLDTYHDSPAWTRESGNRMLPEDLFETYKFNKKVSEDLSEVDVWEMWNEEDVTILFLTETADCYAAHFKAAAIALAEKENAPYVSFGGFSLNSKETEFVDLVMQNGIMDYTDVYNYHNHTVYSDFKTQNAIDMNFDRGLTQIATDYAYDKVGKPIWVSEAGMKLDIQPGEIAPKQSLLNTQARYLITSNVQSLAMGNNKNFWFVFPKYIENGGDFGTFYQFHTPYPAYQSEAVMTYVLGEAKYKGEITNLNVGTRGYAFDNGKTDVAVLWGDCDDTVTLKTDKSVVLTDIMGCEKTINPVDGKVVINTGIDPLFVTFQEKIDDSDYILRLYEERKLNKNTFTDAQKIVLNQTYDNIDFYEGKQYGYRKPMNKPFEMSVEVYNFNDKEMKGSITGSGECNVEFSPLKQEITVPPMSKKKVIFTLKAKENVDYDILYDLKFVGEFDGEKTSPTVSHISFKRDTPLEGMVIPNSYDATKWDATNVMTNTESYVTQGENNEVKIGADMYQPGSWYYPYLPLDGKILKGYDGISFWLKCDKNVPYKEPEFVDAFVYCDDGSKYFMGVKPIAFVDEWRYFYVSWDNWVQFNGGTRGDKVVNPETIISMSIGFNSTRDTQIIAKDITAFKFPKPLKEDTRKIEFNNLKEGDIVGNDKKITVTLPEGTKSTRIMVNNIEHTGNITGNQFEIDISNFKKGYYTLSAIAYTETGYAIDGNVNFNIE